jgi:biopolymer transport protein ExbD
MNLLPHHDDEDGELFEITAMVDVVFILLAFFVLSVAFERPERDLSIGYAQASLPTGSTAEDFPAQVMVRLWPGENGAVRLAMGDRQLPDDRFDQITATLAHMDMPQIPVVIAASANLTVQQVAQAMDAVLASPMKRMSLSRLPGEGGGR